MQQQQVLVVVVQEQEQVLLVLLQQQQQVQEKQQQEEKQLEMQRHQLQLVSLARLSAPLEFLFRKQTVEASQVQHQGPVLALVLGLADAELQCHYHKKNHLN